MPAPPIPAIQMRLPASGCELDELIRDPLRRVGLGGGEHGFPHLGEPRRFAEQAGDAPWDPLRRPPVGDDFRPACAVEVLGVLLLVIGGRVGVRHEDRRLSRGGDLPDGSARARHDEVGCRERRAEIVDERQQAVVRP